MGDARLGQWLVVLGSLLMLLLSAEGFPVKITYLTEAVAKGAGEFLSFMLFTSFLYYFIEINVSPICFPFLMV